MQIGHQDLGALLASQPQVAQRWRAHVMASPFGTAQAAVFNFPRPIGTAMPEPPAYRLASLNTAEPEVTGAISRDFGIVPMPRPRPPDFPAVNRRLKGDLLVARPQPSSPPAGGRDLTPGRVKTVAFPRPDEKPPAEVIPEHVTASPLEPDFDTSVTLAPEPDLGLVQDANAPPDPIDDANPAVRLARLYFGANPVGESVGGIEPWPSGHEPVLIEPLAADPDIKRSALEPAGKPASAAMNASPIMGETVAPKGEVTGAGKRPKSPAERLGLDTKSRAKAEKCLAEAVYFESRGETKRGQIAVAQVVMNRVFSGFYPNNVCGVVYQNAHRYNACQFTFACDGIKDVVTEPDMWVQAKEIARDTLDGKLWLSDIGKSTHYHAYWVHPWWIGTMRKLSKIGVHSFYRPRRWGDGADAPAWGPGFSPDNAKL